MEVFNEKRPRLRARVITAPTGNKPWLAYVLRVDLSWDLAHRELDIPGVMQSCKLRFSKDEDTY